MIEFEEYKVKLNGAKPTLDMLRDALKLDAAAKTAVKNGEIIGTASLNRKPRRMRHRGEFGISLKKAWWGCGAASALTEAILAFAKENGFEQLNLEVRSDNVRAIRLYEKYGFRKLCTFPDFFKIHGESIDFNLMNLALTPADDQAVRNTLHPTSSTNTGC